MHTRSLLFSLFFIILLLNGCGGDSANKNESTFTTDEKNFVHKLFLTEYLWYEDVPQNIDYTHYTTPQALVDALRVYPPDRWSTVTSKQAFENYTNQEESGFGFGYTDDFIIYLVRIHAPAWQKLQRGDQLLTINGKAVTYERIHQASQKLGTPATFTLIRRGTAMEIKIVPDNYTFKVTSSKIINFQGKRIGYLCYDAFSGNSVMELEKAFTLFKNSHIDFLVVDLRYNGGGSVTVASILLDNIDGAHPGSRQFYLDWNANYRQNNENYYFEEASEQDGNELKMKQVYFLVSHNSASASELVISALKPYLGHNNIITIGEATNGKNVGMRIKSYGLNYYYLINFYVKNHLGETSSFNGIPATCSAKDDLSHLRGDINETMLYTALIHIDSGRCP